MKMDTPMTKFRYNQYGKRVGLDWDFHSDHSREKEPEPGPGPGPGPEPEPVHIPPLVGPVIKGVTCKRGHNQSLPGAKMKQGSCRHCRNIWRRTVTFRDHGIPEEEARARATREYEADYVAKATRAARV